MRKDIASIPEPTPTVDGLLATVQALKATVEALAGLRGSSPAARIHLQASAPTDALPGDLWINAANGVATYWNGRTWLLLA